MEPRMTAISVRISTADLQRVKAIAKRLGVRDSDVFRFSIRNTLAQLAPLSDERIRGRQLLPVILEAGPGFVRYFDLDEARLGAILNVGVEDENLLVDEDDVMLISMVGLEESYALVRLNELAREIGAAPIEKDSIAGVLRNYLYEKYIFRNGKDSAQG